MVFGIGKGLGRGYDNAFSSMDSEWIEIFHITHRNAIVIAVPDHFIFNLLPPFQ